MSQREYPTSNSMRCCYGNFHMKWFYDGDIASRPINQTLSGTMRTAHDGHVSSDTKGLHSPKISGKFPIATADCLSSFGKCLTITCGTFFCPKTLEIKILQQIKVRPFCQSLYFHLTNNLRSKHFLLLHTRGVKLDISVWQPTVDNCCPRGFGDLVVR